MKQTIEIDSVQFSYPGGVKIIDIDRLSIGEGERVFLHGPSGCGKTTLLGLLTGILTAQAGSLRILDRDLRSMRSHVRDHFRGEHIGYIFQMFNLLPYLNVIQNILLPVQLNPGRQTKINEDVQEIAAALAERLGIASHLHDRVTDLSVGQQQRVAAARALIGNPEILICDEPTSSLDQAHRNRFLDVLLEMAERHKTTVVFVSHDENLSGYFDRTISLMEINKTHDKNARR